MVKSIQELYDKLEKREKKRLEAGKAISGAHVLFLNALRTINNQSSCIYDDYVFYEKGFCVGFLNCLLHFHYITEDEFNMLEDELIAAHVAYLNRTLSERLDHMAEYHKGATL